VPDTVVTTMKPEARTGHSVVHSSMARCLYVYGGSKNKKWFSDVYMVDADNWTWQCMKVSCKNVAYYNCQISDLRIAYVDLRSGFSITS